MTKNEVLALAFLINFLNVHKAQDFKAVFLLINYKWFK